ncbi:Ail/Lom family outer membrane beta-barrel protein, partial [Escherichia albertii]|uniref:Ail/Lom family outer membrane beta-barrel protein n=1 Tax=Escherichia albertii TaxID=208962 RepID=UPI00237B8330
SYAGDKNRQLTRYSDTRWHEDSVRNRWFSVMAGAAVGGEEMVWADGGGGGG